MATEDRTPAATLSSKHRLHEPADVTQKHTNRNRPAATPDPEEVRIICLLGE